MHIDGTRDQDRAIELILNYYAAFNRGDAQGMLGCLCDDVDHDVNQGGRQAGREAFATFLERMATCYDEQLHDIVVMASADGTRAAAEYVVHGRYQSTDQGLPEARGQRYVLAGGAFFEISGGRVARVSNFYNLNHWLEQVGA